MTVDKPKKFVDARSYTQREFTNQFRQLLDANGVLKPHIIWLPGHALRALFDALGKKPFYKDGVLEAEKVYRFNLCTGRFREAEPFNPDKAKPRP